MPTKEELLLKLFSKKCSVEELKLLLIMIREDQTDVPPRVMDELLQQLGRTDTVTEGTFNRVWQKVTDEITDSEPEVIGPRKGWLESRKLLRVAASVALLIASFFIVQYFIGDRFVVEQSIAGQIKTLTLPDGSLVTLNGNSSIRYQKDWDDNPIRTVELEGEAYFKVRNFGDGTTKFQVLTSDLTVEVLGTSFNVLSWEKETSVFLEEGEVNVKLDNAVDSEVRLVPGEVMRYSARDKKLVPPKMVAKQLEVSWKQGVLEFEETSLEDIIHRVTSPNMLSYTIMDEALAKRVFTLRIPTEDMDVALDVLSRLTGTRIEEVDNRLMIQEKNSDTE